MYCTGFGRAGSFTSTTLNPFENMWPMYAKPRWTMSWTPSGRPP